MNDDYIDPNLKEEELFPVNKHLVPHYYGDLVRKYFLVAGFVLLYATLEDRELLGFYLSVGMISILASVILAGLTSPTKRRIVIYDVIISIILFLIFEYLSVSAYSDRHNFFEIVFFLRQLLAVIFLTTLYFSIKTLRGVKFHK